MGTGKVFQSIWNRTMTRPRIIVFWWRRRSKRVLPPNPQ